MKLQQTFVLKIVFAVISLTVLFQFIPLLSIVAVISKANPLWFGVGVLLQILVRAVTTLQMRVIAANQGVSLGHRQLFRILLVTHFYSLILPGPLAGGGVAWLKYVQHGAGKGAAAAIVVLNRAVGLGVLIVLGACAWTVDRYSDRLLLVVITISFSILAAGITILLPPNKSRVTEYQLDEPRKKKRFDRFLYRLALFLRIPRAGKATILTGALMSSLLSAAAILSFAFAVNAELTFFSALWMLAALQIVLLLPITLAGIGIRDVSLVGLGALVGIPPEVAVAWSFVILSGSIVVAVLGGLTEANVVTLKLERYLNQNGSRRSGRQDDR
jgi:uncharacterized protein (TIRG00374 family)